MATNHEQANDDPSFWQQITLSAILLGMGALLILASLLPWGELATSGSWTQEDATRYDRISLEYHRSAFQPRSHNGRTEQEQAEHRAELKRQFDTLHNRLQQAHRQPERWSRRLFWSGITLLALGIARHLQSG